RTPGLIVDADGDALPLDAATDLERLLPVSGGRAAAVFGEWEAGAFRVLTVEIADAAGTRRVVPL
ncbi:MAG TPA: hypothetical protein PKA93_13280, partial [Arachnia sp.]|nr:hypothetical protein [Arachnia sp.]